MAKKKRIKYRPYSKFSIEDLEYLAEKHWEDNKFLREIKKELSFRKTSRAKKLESKIRSKLNADLERLKDLTKFCDECGSFMEIKFGRYGMFWGCTDYPYCKHTTKITKEDMETS